MREYDMTPQQQNIYDMVRRYPDSCIGNIGGVIRFAVDGNLPDGREEESSGSGGEGLRVDSVRIHETVCRVQEINASLRLRVNRDGHLYLSDECSVPFEVWDGHGESEEEVRRRIQQWTDLPVFAYDACLVRYLVIETEAYLYLAGVYHHLICDGIGLMKVTGELWELGTDEQSPLWQDAEPDERFLSYLEEMEQRRVKPFPEAYREVCIQEHFVFPARRESVSDRAEVIRQRFNPSLSGQISGWCEKHGLTAEHVLEAALAVHDCAITGREWTGFGRVMINRKKKYMDTAGMFTNVLPLVVQVSAGTSFEELCHAIKTQEYHMLKCGDATVGELKTANRLTGRLYDTCITYRPLKRLPLQHADYMWESECSAVEVPLRILIDEQADGLWLTYKYLADCYSSREIRELDCQVQEIIRKGIRDISNGQQQEGDASGIAKGPLADTVSCGVLEGFVEAAYADAVKEQRNLKTLASSETIEQAFSETGASVRPEKRDGSCPAEDVVAAFDRNVREEGDRVFLIDLMQAGREITYREAGVLTDRIAEGLAALRRTVQVKKGSLGKGQGTDGQLEQQEPWMVGLRLSRSMWMPLTILACLKTGIVFVPVAVTESEERLAALQAQIGVILTDEWVEKTVSAKQKTTGNGSSKLKSGTDKVLQTGVDEVLRTGSEQSRRPAYGIHTSGSTGTPKLVRIYRDALNLRLAWMKESFGLSGCRILQKTRNTFDVSVWELLLPAVCGGSLVMLPDGWEREPEKILWAVKQYQVDTLHFVPSMLSVYLSWAEHAKATGRTFVKRVFSSGEALSPAMVERFYTCFPFTRLYNLYGPAECTIDVAWHACLKGERVTPIGRPVWETELFVVNPKGQQVPDGYIGEILVTGALVGEGYIGNPKETAAHFCEWNGRKAYHTGDLGYYSDTGELVYAGRMDREIKLRGMRVSLSLLEQEAAAVSGVQKTAALVSDQQLVLFAGTRLQESELRAQLAKRVAPHYMPDGILCLEKLPYNRNGKCDYDALRNLYKRRGAGGKERSPRSLEPEAAGKNRQATGTGRRNNNSNRYRRDANSHRLAVRGRKMAGAGKTAAMADDTVRLQRILADTLNKLPGQGMAVSPGDSLKDRGLDSLSVVSWMLALEKQGVKVSYEDIAGAGTIRELAGLLEMRMQNGISGGPMSVQNAKEHPFSDGNGTENQSVPSMCGESENRSEIPGILKRLTEPIPQERRQGYVLAVPYAGMGIQCFSTLAEAFADRGYELLACDVSGRRWSVSAMTDAIADEFAKRVQVSDETLLPMEHVLKEKPEAAVELVVLGCCVGSALAIYLAQRLKQHWNGTVRLALIGSLPVTFLGNADRQKLLWDLLPLPAANLCLGALQGRKLKVTEGMYQRLRMDAKKYVRCLAEWEETPLQIDTQLFYGSRDVLTFGFQNKYTQWKKYLAGRFRVTELAGAYHFCLHSHAGRIAEQIAGSIRCVSGQYLPNQSH